MTIEQEITKNMTSEMSMELSVEKNVLFLIIDQFTDLEKNTYAKILSIPEEHWEYYLEKMNKNEVVLFPIPKKSLPHIVKTMNPNQIGEYLQKVLKREGWQPTAVNLYCALSNLNMQYDYN